jgi:hypothetical protein
MTFESTHHSVSLRLALTFEPAAAWDAFEITLRFSGREAIDTSLLTVGLITFGFAPLFGVVQGRGMLHFETTNLSQPQIVPGVLAPEEQTRVIRWSRIGQKALMDFEVVMTETPSDAGPGHPIQVRAIESILKRYAVTFVVLSTDSAWNIRRFGHQMERYHQVFANDGIVIFNVV